MRYRLAADIGGTFTDIVLVDDLTNEYRTTKVPTTPESLEIGIMKGFDEIVRGDYSAVTSIVHGTTAGLNAVIERRGARSALITTKGFRDVYEIGRGNRPEIYNNRYRRPKPLIERKDIYELPERVGIDGTVHQPVAETDLELLLEQLWGRYEAVAISLLNSYANPSNEKFAADWLKARMDDGVTVITSSETAREWREYERTSTTVLNAYVAPKTKNHLLALGDELRQRGYRGNLYLMQSNGGVIKAELAGTKAVHALMSGPVGGAIGASHSGRGNAIGIDMGGTSFDVSLIVDGRIETAVEAEVEGFPLLAPTVNIISVGAGGGSIAWSEAGGMRVGPKSAGARPGPVGYGHGGKEPTITDANLVLGRLDPENFLDGRMVLDIDEARRAFERYGREIGLDGVTAAEGVCAIANHKMADAIREITVRRGIDPRGFSLLAFGGAGPMHAAMIAEELDIREVVVPASPGVFSAWGMLQADIRHDAVRTVKWTLPGLDGRQFAEVFAALRSELAEVLREEGFAPDEAVFVKSLDIRYLGQEYTINVAVREGAASVLDALEHDFHRLHQRLYGHSSPAEEIELVNARLTASVPSPKGDAYRAAASAEATSSAVREFEGIFGAEPHLLKVYERSRLLPGSRLQGPLIVVELTATTVVPPHWELTVDQRGNLVLADLRKPVQPAEKIHQHIGGERIEP